MTLTEPDAVIRAEIEKPLAGDGIREATGDEVDDLHSENWELEAAETIGSIEP